MSAHEVRRSVREKSALLGTKRAWSYPRRQVLVCPKRQANYTQKFKFSFIKRGDHE